MNDGYIEKPNAVTWNAQVVTAAAGRVPVFLDGGVRRGTDVLKALALGASGVFVSVPTSLQTLDYKNSWMIFLYTFWTAHISRDSSTDW